MNFNKIKPFFLFVIFLIVGVNEVDASTKKSNSLIILTSPIRYIGMDSAICGAKIVNPNSENIIKAGLCWSKTPQPTIDDFKTERVSTTDSFNVTIHSLLPQTVYYVKSYFITSSGIIYGPQRVFATDKIEIGRYIKGGKLFYVFKPGDIGYVEGEFHGLILAERYGFTFTWSNTIDTLVGALDSTLLSGKANTIKIVNVLGVGIYPAKICDDLVFNGYSDWYLPALEELVLLGKSGLGGGPSWSSTEFSKTHARNTSGSIKKTSLKSSKFLVYPIRSF